MSTTSHPSAGFTLIELLVVLAIVGVAIGLVVPFLARRQPQVSLAGAAIELTAVLRGARAEAIAEDRPVVFSGGAGGYFVDGRWRRLAVAAAAPAALRIDIAGGARISFYPSGGSSGGRVVVRNRTARREIAVDAVTGNAAIVR
jgi:general secretion pathway protein H